MNTLMITWFDDLKLVTMLVTEFRCWGHLLHMLARDTNDNWCWRPSYSFHRQIPSLTSFININETEMKFNLNTSYIWGIKRTRDDKYCQNVYPVTLCDINYVLRKPASRSNFGMKSQYLSEKARTWSITNRLLWNSWFQLL